MLLVQRPKGKANPIVELLAPIYNPYFSFIEKNIDIGELEDIRKTIKLFIQNPLFAWQQFAGAFHWYINLCD